MKKHLQTLSLVVAALLIAACSVSRLAYLNAPPLALWYLGGYVDMSDQQKGFVKERLSQAMAWHRQAELPDYRRALETIGHKLEGRITPADARATWNLGRDYYHRSIEHLLPDMADFIRTLDESQLARIQKKFDDDNKKMVKESVKGTPQERREKRTKKYIDQFEEWTGRLSEQQREVVSHGTLDLGDLTEERLGDRRYRQTEFLRLAREKPPRDKLVAELKRLLVDTDSWRRPDYVKKLRERDERLFEVVAQLSATLTPDQRASVQKKLGGYSKDISSIIASR